MPCGSRRHAAFQEYRECFPAATRKTRAQVPPSRPESERERECPPCPPEPARQTRLDHHRAGAVHGWPRMTEPPPEGKRRVRCREQASRRREKRVPRCQFVVPQPQKLPDQGFHVRRLTLPPIPQVQAAGRDEVRLVERDSRLASCIFREEDLRQRARGLYRHLTEAPPAAHRVFLASRPTSSMSCPAVRTRYPCARSCSSSAVHAHC